MRCPSCGHPYSRSRKRVYIHSRRRRNLKSCCKCDHHFTVIEAIAGDPLPKPDLNRTTGQSDRTG